MNQRNYGMYALAAAIVVVGALMVGASLESLAGLALVAACPLMMIFMMKGMHGQDMHGGHSHDGRDDDPLRKHDQHQHPGSGQR
jgi:choline-glycine betaine transporter